MRGKFDLAKWAEGVRKKHGDDSAAYNEIVLQMVEAMSVLNPETGCRTIPGVPTRNGYATTRDGEHVYHWYRIVAQCAHGKKERGLHTRHLCGDRACVERSHLCYGSAEENMADKIRHGKTGRRLTVEQVALARTLYAEHGKTPSEIENILGIERVKGGGWSQMLTGMDNRGNRVFADCPVPPIPGRRVGHKRGDLTDEQAAYAIMRLQEGESQSQVARDLGKSPGVICALANGATFKHISRNHDLSVWDDDAE